MRPRVQDSWKSPSRAVRERPTQQYTGMTVHGHKRCSRHTLTGSAMLIRWRAGRMACEQAPRVLAAERCAVVG